MPDQVILAILLVLAFIVLACAVMALLAWALVLILRARERKRGPHPAGKQSIKVANGLFELAEVPEKSTKTK